ncbi:helix-turn-helix domain-containing protein [Actinophytocola sediminis]
MLKKMGYQWRLRHLMADRDMFQTSDLVPLLAERGIVLSREQVYRMVTQPPQRLSMDTLVALCDILDCEPNDLIKPEIVNQQLRRTAESAAGTTGDPAPAPRRSVVRRPDQHRPQQP